MAALQGCEKPSLPSEGMGEGSGVSIDGYCKVERNPGGDNAGGSQGSGSAKETD